MIVSLDNPGRAEPRRGRTGWEVPYSGLYEGYGGKAADIAGRIGPNAITQLEPVLRTRIGAAATAELFAGAGLAHYVDRPPGGMVDEREVARLHRHVRRTLPAHAARTILTEAGDRTGRYILAHRIPGPAKFVLGHLPAAWAARLLTQAIRKHAWTFAGSATFDMGRAKGSVIVARIAGNPIVSLDRGDRPICVWHAAVFQRLFRTLVDEVATVTETECCAAGDPACRFEIRLNAH